MPVKRKASALDGAAPPAKRTKKMTARKTVRTWKKNRHTATSGERVPDFYKSEFMKTEKIDAASFPAPDLSNVVHPLFARKLFRPAVDYPVIRMSARLASKLLETEAVQALLYTIVAHRDPLRRLSTEDTYGPHVGYSERDCSPKFQDTGGVKRRRIEAALADLAPLVSFQPGVLSFTKSTTVPVEPKAAFPAHQRRSLIRYEQALHDDLRRAYHATPTDEIKLIALQFRFGLMLAHEVIHALVNAVEGKLNTEPFLWGAVVSEAGFEAEHRWFGGHLELIFRYVEKKRRKRTVRTPLKSHRYADDRGLSGLAGIFILMQHPDRGIISTYRSENLYMSVRNEESLPESDLGWRIPMTWIAEFFQDAFWQRVDSAGDLQDTLAPMKVGQYFQTDAEGDMQPVKPPKTLPKGYRRVSIGWNVAKLITKPKARKGPTKGVRTRGQDRM